MKKVLCMCLAFCLMLTAFAGCGKEDSNTDINNKNVGGDDGAVNQIAEKFNITYGTNFQDGIAFIQFLDENDNAKTVAIDTLGKILFEADDNITNNVTTLGGYKNSILVLNDIIYDKSGNIIASPELSGYDNLIATYNGYSLARKKEESYLGDKYYFGVLNNKGEWEYSLSADHPIVQAYNSKEWSISDLYGFSDHCVAEYIVDVTPVSTFSENLYYNIKTNEVTSDYVRYESRNYQGEDSGIYKYDTNGNRQLILKDVVSNSDVFFKNAFVGTTLTWDEYGYIEGGCKLYDYNGNILTDLSEYKITSVWSNNGTGEYYVNEHLLIPIDNGSGSNYLCLINKSGKTAFEPIKISSNDDYYPLDEKGFIYKSVDENNYNNVKYMLYDYSGNVTIYEDVNRFEGFNDGLALVQNTAGQWYYINYEGEIIIK